MNQPAATVALIPRQKPVRLALADSEYGCCRSHSTPSSPHVARHFDPF
ncbi:hypothetical protein HDF16_004994 [Granulicella aggregans]|uniref:Uncharacterized protein n=1 Tax=Granulicella aggregans TaxID=474949 RepID=A0A7W8E5L6_9BACT|nr:hypothetical protein [Granulicella aggregans]